MFNKQLEKMNSLFNSAKVPSHLAFDSIALISTNVARPNTTTTLARTTPSRSTPKFSKQITLIKEQLDDQLRHILQNLFKTKCKDLHIQFNECNWESFVRTFMLKNKFVKGEFESKMLDLSDFYLSLSSIPHINSFIVKYQFQMVNLSKNTINPISFSRLYLIKQLILNNCKLGNDALEPLFQRLSNSIIVRISLSSPELKDRNQLTRYQKLIELIKKSSTLTTLQLSNIEINPINGIMQSCRGTVLKRIDLSDNTNVRGICPTLKSLNLSKNGITVPFDQPIVPSELEHLNLSYNKIPYYQFKDFLKISYFSFLKHLILDHLQINGQVYPLQNFIEQSLSLTYLSLVDCDLNTESFFNIAAGVRNSRNLRFLDLTRNRVANEKIAEYVSSILQSLGLMGLRMRHCDIKDKYGAIIFQGLRKSKYLQSIDMMNNLLGDETARTICNELKLAKNILQIELQQNIIKYKDMQEIRSYLAGNKYHGQSRLYQEYGKLSQVNRQQVEVERAAQLERERTEELEREVEVWEQQFYQKFKVQNQKKKQYLKQQIQEVRKVETVLQNDIFLRETLMMASSSNDLLSRKQSALQNPESNLFIPQT